METIDNQHCSNVSTTPCNCNGVPTMFTGYSFWDRLCNFLHKFTFTNLNKLGKFWISCQVIADMKKVYNDLIIINLYLLELSSWKANIVKNPIEVVDTFWHCFKKNFCSSWIIEKIVTETVLVLVHRSSRTRPVDNSP